VSDGHADLALLGGAVFTGDGVRSWAQGVAAKAGRIVAVGSDEQIRALIGPNTDVVQLRGRMVVAGFQDAHCHVASGGLDMLRCALHDLHDLRGYLDAIGAYAQANPDVPWILGGGWAIDVFAGGWPTKESLDAIVHGRPVFLPNRDGHTAWVNSKALELAGISSSTPDPRDGRVERAPDGEPSGSLHEGAAKLVGNLIPALQPEEVYQGMLRGQRYMHSIGITAWQDAIVERGVGDEGFDAYVSAAERGTLKARVVGALWWDRDRGVEQIEGLKELRRIGTIGRLNCGTVKIMQDGVLENFTGAILSSYRDAAGSPTEASGISMVDPQALKQIVPRLDAEGFQVHFHTIGDRAVREALDGIQAAVAANGASDHRHTLAHIQLVHPDDIPRFRELGVVANAQALWAAHEGQMDDLTIPFLEPESAGRQYPFASLVRAGAMLAMGSDWSVSTADPFDQIHVAVNRMMPSDYTYGNGNGEVFLPEERLDLPTALAAFTIGSAYVNHLDRDTGSIETGKFADLAVVDRNIFELPATEIGDANVDMTFVEGELVYEAASPD
jgi:predicted amidohydrolase YtcJ